MGNKHSFDSTTKDSFDLESIITAEHSFESTLKDKFSFTKVIENFVASQSLIASFLSTSNIVVGTVKFATQRTADFISDSVITINQALVKTKRVFLANFISTSQITATPKMKTYVTGVQFASANSLVALFKMLMSVVTNPLNSVLTMTAVPTLSQLTMLNFYDNDTLDELDSLLLINMDYTSS